MKRIVAAAATVVAGTVLAACGGQSPYCAAIEENEPTLSSFGKTRTNEAYTNYATVLRSVAESAPASVKDDWTALADATDAIVAAQDEVGVPLDDMRAEGTVEGLDQAQLATLNEAYEAFNDTTDQRDAVVKDAKIECEITLS